MKKTILLSILLFFLVFNPAKSAAYDLYVDKSYDGDEEGTSEKPYKSIEKAVEESSSKGKKIYIKNGTYDEQLVLSKGIELYGENKEKTIIKASGSTALTMKNNNLIKNITIQDGTNAITIEGRAEISDCIIKNASKNGINMLADSGELKIKNSKITGNGKGFYIQKGSKVSIADNEISGNNEEGVDLRENISGNISGNYIIGNGEGGIEIIVGSSNVSITNNQIKKNKASGIAAQFYSQASKTGEITIKKNTVSGNGIYGIVCKAPSGGDIPRGYYNESLKLNENKIENNKKKSISGSCKIIEAVSDEEEKTNQTVESETASTQLEEETAEETEENRELEIILEKEKQLDNLIYEISFNYEGSKEKANETIKEIKEGDKIKTFFFGPDNKKITILKKELEKMKQDKKILENNIEEIGEDAISNSKNKALEQKEEIEKTIKSIELSMEEQEKKFSLFGWVFKIFQNKEIVNYSS